MVVFVALIIGPSLLMVLAYVLAWPESPYLVLPVLGLLLVLPFAAVAVYQHARARLSPGVPRFATTTLFFFFLGLLVTVVSLILLVLHLRPLP